MINMVRGPTPYGMLLLKIVVRSNVFSDLTGPGGQLPTGVSGNRLEIVGSPRAFERTNRAVEPAPGVEFFTGAGQ